MGLLFPKNLSLTPPSIIMEGIVCGIENMTEYLGAHFLNEKGAAYVPNRLFVK